MINKPPLKKCPDCEEGWHCKGDDPECGCWCVKKKRSVITEKTPVIVEILEMINELPVLSIHGSGFYNRVKFRRITKNGFMNFKSTDEPAEWNVGWYAVDYRDILKIIKRSKEIQMQERIDNIKLAAELSNAEARIKKQMKVIKNFRKQ